MPLASELIQIGIVSREADFLGHTPSFDLTAAGNASQANAYQITATMSNFVVVTATNNSAKLPLLSTVKEGVYIVRNDDGADVLNVFPAVGDSFNALAANTSVAIAIASSRIFFKASGTRWIST